MSLAYDTAQTRQDTAFSDPSDLVARRMGFIPLPLAVAMARVLCTTLSPSAKPANLILFFLGYLILVALRVFNSLIILGKACDLISSHTNNDNVEVKSEHKKTFQRTQSVNNDSKEDPNYGMAMFCNSAVSLNNVCLNDALLNSEKIQQNSNNIRAESEPLLPQ